MYNLMVWYTYPLWNEYQDQGVEIINKPSPHIVNSVCVCVCVCVGVEGWGGNASDPPSATFKNIMPYGIINYSRHAAHWILRIYSPYNWKFVPFDLHLYHFYLRPPNPWQLIFCSLFLWSGYFFLLHTKYKWSLYTICLSLYDLFHSAECPPGSSMLSQVAGSSFFSMVG